MIVYRELDTDDPAIILGEMVKRIQRARSCAIGDIQEGWHPAFAAAVYITKGPRGMLTVWDQFTSWLRAIHGEDKVSDEMETRQACIESITSQILANPPIDMSASACAHPTFDLPESSIILRGTSYNECLERMNEQRRIILWSMGGPLSGNDYSRFCKITGWRAPIHSLDKRPPVTIADCLVAEIDELLRFMEHQSIFLQQGKAGTADRKQFEGGLSLKDAAPKFIKMARNEGLDHFDVPAAVLARLTDPAARAKKIARVEHKAKEILCSPKAVAAIRDNGRTGRQRELEPKTFRKFCLGLIDEWNVTERKRKERE